MKGIHQWLAGLVVALGLGAGAALAAPTPADGAQRAQVTTAPIVGAPADLPSAQVRQPAEPAREARVGVDIDPLTVLLAAIGIGALLLLRRASADR
jgi:hypothetical protein